jgi:hypothetical protein
MYLIFWILIISELFNSIENFLFGNLFVKYNVRNTQICVNILYLFPDLMPT